jgi:hypothetical protein
MISTGTSKMERVRHRRLQQGRIQPYLVGKPDTTGNECWHDKEQVKWDAPRIVALDITGATADHCHDDTANLFPCLLASEDGRLTAD